MQPVLLPLKNIDLPMGQIEAFCQKWQIVEFALFGSVLRDDFRPESDLDVLVSFEPNAPWGILELVEMEQELAQLVERDVDLIEKQVIEKSDNYIRREEILTTAKVLYAPTYEAA